LEFLREHAQPHIAPRKFLVEPPDQDHIGNGGDVSSPILPPARGLRHASEQMIALEDRLDVLLGHCDDLPFGAIEQEFGVRHESSVTLSVPVPALLPRAAIFCPGVTTMISTQLSGNNVLSASATGVPSPILMRTPSSVADGTPTLATRIQ